MDTPRMRGRKPGVTKQVTTIKDPILGDYHIEIEERSQYNVMKKGVDKPIAFCSNFPNAIKCIIHKSMFTKNETLTIKEYLDTYKREYDKIYQTLGV